MQIDPALHSTADNYKLLTNLVVPRPIAWVTSLGADGVVNLAPYSFFNAVGADPLYVVVSVGRRDDTTPKDTLRNAEAGNGFVVHLVTGELAGAMNVSAVELPPERSEIEAAGLTVVASERVRAPRLAEAQVAMECRLDRTIPIGANTLMIGEVVMFHVADALIDDRLRIHGFAPLGRLGSPSTYCQTTTRFELPRFSLAQWESLDEAGRAAARRAQAPVPEAARDT